VRRIAADNAIAGDAAFHDPLTRKLLRLVALSPAETDLLRGLQSHGRLITARPGDRRRGP
jgi:hypothetical protein